MISNPFDNFLEKIKDDFTHIIADGEGAAEFSGYVDTGCFILNALLSGSIYGGLPNNKISAFAGESATGKTFLVLGIVKSYLADPNARVIYYDTEAAVTNEMMTERGIDTSRVIVSEPETIQKFRTHAIKVLDSYSAIPAKDKFPLLVVLDSLGMLSTSKELEDSTEGKDTRDMTRAQVIRAAFRTLTLKAAKAKVPIIVTNHVYTTMGMFPTNEVSGGGGLKYAASTIVTLSKSKDKDGKEIVGSFLRAKAHKSRLSKENSVVSMRLSYSSGLDKYYGLLDLAEKHNIIKKVSTRYELPDGTKIFGKTIEDDPEKYFTDDILQQLDVAAGREFKYGAGVNED